MVQYYILTVRYRYIIDRLKTFFAEVKKNYPGTIDSKVNIVKKSVSSIIQNYSGLGLRTLRTIFPDVKWMLTGNDTGNLREIADDVAGDIEQADGNEEEDWSDAFEESSGSSESDSGESYSGESDSGESDAGPTLTSIATDVLKPRTARKDCVDLSIANKFLHDMSPLDTNTHGKLLCCYQKG